MLWEFRQRLLFTWKFKRHVIWVYLALFAVVLAVILLWVGLGISERM